MKIHSLLALVVIATAGLTGCAGTNFVRPAEGELVVGKSARAEVTKKMGDPWQTGELMKNDQTLKLAKYAYAATGGESAYPGVIPARGLTFAFFNDKLVSQEFVSSFKEDSTDFDGKKLASIVKGKSTKQDVVALLGKPTGEAIYPVIKGAKDYAYTYNYTQAKGTAFNMKFYSKSCVVSFNDAGVVSDVEYVTSGDQ
ncbi:MAG: outer membrane protein assembly factor BamE [Proteobacteria bacterium]|nr:outer membrane protein assembly factor BamE [Pseudomonadota bacterium]